MGNESGCYSRHGVDRPCWKTDSDRTRNCLMEQEVSEKNNHHAHNKLNNIA